MKPLAFAAFVFLAAAAFACAAEWSGHGQNQSAPRIGSPVKLFSYWNDGAAAGLGSAVLSTNESGSWANYSGEYGSPLALVVYENMITTDRSTPSPDYAARVWLNESNFNYSLCRSDGGDIRFYAAPRPPAVDPRNQLVYFKFDNNTAYGENVTRAYDYSGNGRNGTISGAVYADGVFGKALDFNGAVTDNVVEASVSSASLDGAYTFEAWIKPLSGGPGYPTIIAIGQDDLWFGLDDYSGASASLEFWYDYGTMVVSTADEAVAYGNLYHVAYTWDGATNDNRLYLNGELVANATTAVPINGSGLRIGNSPYSGEWFKGAIDNVIIHNRTLSPDEIRDHATLTPTDAKLQYWSESWKVNGSSSAPPAANGSEQLYYIKFDNASEYGESDSLAYDYSGNGLNGTISGAAYAAGKFGNGMGFGGGGGAVDLASPISLGASDNFSVEMWIYPSNLTSPANQEIIDRTADIGSVIDFFNGGAGGGDICFRIRDSGGAGLSQVCAAGNLTSGSWFHVVGSRDAPTQTLRIYVNGALQASAAETTSAGFSLTPRLGNHATLTYGFNGTMDNVIMYNRSLSGAEILDHYNAVAPGNDSVFWVKLPDTGTSNFVMRYGNSSLTSESSGSFTSAMNATVWPERALSIFGWLNATAPAGTRVGWRIWANDSSGNWNSTPVLSFLLGSPPAAQADKSSYSSCGTVYYRVSAADEGGSPVDADLSISAHDPTGASRYSVAASTSGGFYQSSFALPPGFQLGIWTLKAYACSVLGQKEFYSGEGDGNVLKVTAKGDKVRYSQGETATFAVKVVDQRGVGVAGLWPVNMTATLDSSTQAGSVVDDGAGSYTVSHSTAALSADAAHQLTIRAWAGALNSSASAGFYVVP